MYVVLKMTNSLTDNKTDQIGQSDMPQAEYSSVDCSS